MQLLLLLAACTGDDPKPDDSAGTPTQTVDTSVTHIGDADTDTDADTDADGDTDTDPAAEAAYAALYDPTVLQEVHLTLSAEAEAALRLDPATYVSGTVVIGADTLKDVGVRLRGAEGFDTKPSFRIKFTEFGGDRYATLERMLLDGMSSDATQVHAVLANNLWQDAGMVGPSANFAKVWLNEVYVGLYANLEVQDDRFADRYFPGAEEGGDFWEAQDSADLTENGIARFDLVSGDGDTQALANADAILNAPGADFSAVAPTVMDLDQYLDFWAWSLVLGCQDGYPYETDEFNLYRLPSTGLYVWTNQALENSFDTAIDWDRLRGDVGVHCMHDPQCEAALWDAVDAALGVWGGWDVHTAADDLYLLTDTAMNEDPNKPFTVNEVDQARSRFLTRVDGLPDRVRAWIGERPVDDGDSGP